MKLWLVRHAAPMVDQGMCYGATDVQADPQATADAARALAAHLPSGLTVSSSPLRRCIQLAEALEALRPDLAYRCDARLAEMDFGCWEGTPWRAIPRGEFERWESDFAGYRFGGRECVAEFAGRIAAAAADARHAGSDVAWVMHAGVARVVRLLAAGVGVPRCFADWPRASLAFGAAQAVTFASNACVAGSE